MRIAMLLLALTMAGCPKPEPVLCDFTCDGKVGADDLAAQQAMHGSTSEKYDVDGDGIVAGSDLGICVGEYSK